VQVRNFTLFPFTNSFSLWLIVRIVENEHFEHIFTLGLLRLLKLLLDFFKKLLLEIAKDLNLLRQLGFFTWVDLWLGESIDREDIEPGVGAAVHLVEVAQVHVVATDEVGCTTLILHFAITQVKHVAPVILEVYQVAAVANQAARWDNFFALYVVKVLTVLFEERDLVDELDFVLVEIDIINFDNILFDFAWLLSVRSMGFFATRRHDVQLVISVGGHDCAAKTAVSKLSRYRLLLPLKAGWVSPLVSPFGLGVQELTSYCTDFKQRRFLVLLSAHKQPSINSHERHLFPWFYVGVEEVWSLSIATVVSANTFYTLAQTTLLAPVEVVTLGGDLVIHVLSSIRAWEFNGALTLILIVRFPFTMVWVEDSLLGRGWAEKLTLVCEELEVLTQIYFVLVLEVGSQQQVLSRRVEHAKSEEQGDALLAEGWAHTGSLDQRNECFADTGQPHVILESLEVAWKEGSWSLDHTLDELWDDSLKSFARGLQGSLKDLECLHESVVKASLKVVFLALLGRIIRWPLQKVFDFFLSFLISAHNHGQ
jgi:hypothetical protein